MSATSVLWIFIALIAAIGACVGSFLNVVIWRVPEKMSLLSPPSHCPKCGAPVRWRDNIPILSWLILRGKCRDCKTPISARYPIVEALGGLIALTIALAFLWGGWTGDARHAYQWHGCADFMNAWGVALEAPRVDDSDEANEQRDAQKLTIATQTNVVDQFFNVLFATCAVVVLLVLIADCALMLGFVEYDRGRSPTSLVAASLIILVCATIAFVKLGDDAESVERIKAATMSVALGAAPLALFAKAPDPRARLENATLGALWGFSAGALGGAVGSLAILLIAKFAKRKTSRNILGLCVFFAVLALWLAQVGWARVGSP